MLFSWLQYLMSLARSRSSVSGTMSSWCPIDHVHMDATCSRDVNMQLCQSSASYGAFMPPRTELRRRSAIFSMLFGTFHMSSYIDWSALTYSNATHAYCINTLICSKPASTIPKPCYSTNQSWTHIHLSMCRLVMLSCSLMFHLEDGMRSQQMAAILAEFSSARDNADTYPAMFASD